MCSVSTVLISAFDAPAFSRFFLARDLEEFQEELRDLSVRRARAALNENQSELPL